MQKALAHYIRLVPVAAPVVLVVVQALVDNGYLSLSSHMLALLNAVLVSLGLHALHLRTK